MAAVRAGDALLQRDALGGAAIGVLERHGQLRLLIVAAALARRVLEVEAGRVRRAPRARPGARRRAAEEGLEEVGEARRDAAAPAAERSAADRTPAEVELHALPAGRRAELLAAMVVAAELVVAAPLLRVLQDLVGLGHLLELGLGVLGLVDVRMELLGELAEGLLDVVLGGRAVDAEHFVVVDELHPMALRRGLRTGDGSPRLYALSGRRQPP